MRGLLKLGAGPVWGRLLSSLLAPGVPGPAAPAARLAGAPVNCKSRLSVSVVVKASTVSFLDHEGQKQKKHKKITKQKTKQKKMFRSKQQNSQPNREAPTASESASPRAIAPQRGSRSAAPGAGSALAGGRREGRDSVFYHVFLPGPTQGSVGQWRAAAGPSRKSGQQDSTLAADCASGGTAGRARGRGLLFISGLRLCPVTLCLALWAPATPPAAPPTPVSCEPGEEFAATGGCPTSSPGVRPQHQGLICFQNYRAPRPPPST